MSCRQAQKIPPALKIIQSQVFLLIINIPVQKEAGKKAKKDNLILQQLNNEAKKINYKLKVKSGHIFLKIISGKLKIR